MRAASFGDARTECCAARVPSMVDDDGSTLARSLIACSSTSCLMGLVRKPVHPAVRHFSRSPFNADAVRAMIGVGNRPVARSHCRIRCVAVMPSMIGICQSISTRS